jgi:hypothetical protein
MENNDTFFSQENCDRCGKPLDSRTMSWFTKECICMGCSALESDIKTNMRIAGKNPSSFEGCGFVPTEYLGD